MRRGATVNSYLNSYLTTSGRSSAKTEVDEISQRTTTGRARVIVFLQAKRREFHRGGASIAVRSQAEPGNEKARIRSNRITPAMSRAPQRVENTRSVAILR